MADDRDKSAPEEPELREGEEDEEELVELDPEEFEHPILAHAIDLLDQENDDAPFTLSEDNEKKLAEQLEELAGHVELPVAVDALFRLAHALATEHPVSEDASKAILRTVERPPIIQALKELVEFGESLIREVEGEEVIQQAKAFDRFSGKDAAAKSAPKVGDKKPKGAVTLDKFNIPRKG